MSEKAKKTLQKKKKKEEIGGKKNYREFLPSRGIFSTPN